MQTILLIGFISLHGDQFDLPYPRGTGFGKAGALQFLPSGQRKKGAFDLYKEKRPSLVNAAMCVAEESDEERKYSTAPLTFTEFFKVRNQHYPFIRIS